MTYRDMGTLEGLEDACYVHALIRSLDSFVLVRHLSCNFGSAQAKFIGQWC